MTAYQTASQPFSVKLKTIDHCRWDNLGNLKFQDVYFCLTENFSISECYSLISEFPSLLSLLFIRKKSPKSKLFPCWLPTVMTRPEMDQRCNTKWVSSTGGDVSSSTKDRKKVISTIATTQRASHYNQWISSPNDQVSIECKQTYKH